MLHYAVDAGVARLTMDAPDTRNALSADLLRTLRHRLSEAVDDTGVRVVVLAHTGPVFCSGMDLRATVDAAPAEQPVVAFPALLDAVWSCPKPVVARVGGKARAGGVGLVAACDIAVAARDTNFAFTEVRLGVVPAVISATVLPRLLPRAAHELFLTGETFDAERAVAVGLVNQAVDVADLDAEVDRYARMLARGAPGALAATKRLLRRDRSGPLADDLARMGELSARAFAGAEGQEGIAAFRAKRPPSWAPDAAP